jgi:hypothetical protein
MNLKLEIFHYSCEKYDENIDGVPEFHQTSKPEGGFLGEDFAHFECENCQQKIAIRFITTESLT